VGQARERGCHDKFIDQALKDFERHLQTIGLGGALEQRMRGARQFARYLVGRPADKDEVTTGRPISN
jgi:hypothetical protein